MNDFIHMVIQDLRRAGVDEVLITGWKYDALKVLHPDKVALLEQAKSLILYFAGMVNSTSVVKIRRFGE